MSDVKENLMRFWKRKEEVRADNEETNSVDAFIQSLIGKDELTKADALQIPTVAGCIDLIAGMVASIPILLYKQLDGKTEVVKNDSRVYLLNKDTNDTLTPVQFWKAMIEDYYLDSGAYAYIHKAASKFRGLHYVDQTHIAVQYNFNPIFKDYDVFVDGARYYPFDFLKLLRKTKNGCESVSLLKENELILAVAYNSMKFENALVKKGGNKKGFLQSTKKLSAEAITKLKEAFRNLYSNNQENVVVLNDGITFKESSNTSVEMQLKENKEINSGELAKLFKVPVSVLKGTATQADMDNFIKFCIMPLLNDIEKSLNRDLLTEVEKGDYYFAFDTRELNRGNIKERYEAYQIALKSHFMQPDEIRNMENLEPLGIDWLELGLDSVLYDPKTKLIYTPNTNATSKLEGNNVLGGEQDAD